MSELRYLAFRTLFYDSSFAKLIKGFMNVFPFACSFYLLGKLFHIVLICPVIC